MAVIRCPECSTDVDEGEFACPKCELILNPSSAPEEGERGRPSIVQALLSPTGWSGPDEQLQPPPRQPRSEQVTVRTPLLMDEYAIPRMVASLDLVLRPLHPFEARVASFLDGKTSVPDIARAAELSLVEVQAVLKSLLERRIIELHRREPRPERWDDEPAEDSRQVGDPDTDPGFGDPPADGSLAFAGVPDTDPGGRTLLDDSEDEDEHTDTALAAAAADDEPSRTDPESFPAGEDDGEDEDELPPSVTRLPTAASRGSTRASQPDASTPSVGVPVLRSIPLSTSAPQVTTAPGRPTRMASPAPPARSAPPPPEPAENVIERAIILERSGESARAIEVLKRGMAQAKNPAPIYNKLALILVNQRHDYQSAVELLSRALELDPANNVYEKNLNRVVSLQAAAMRRSSPPDL